MGYDSEACLDNSDDFTQVDKRIAIAVGFEEAAFLRVLHGWMKHHKSALQDGDRRYEANFYEGRIWVQRTRKEWLLYKNTPFLRNVAKVRRVLKNLMDMGVVLQRRMYKDNHEMGSMYTIHFDVLSQIMDQENDKYWAEFNSDRGSAQNEPRSKMDRQVGSKRTDVSAQNEPPTINSKRDKESSEKNQDDFSSPPGTVPDKRDHTTEDSHAESEDSPIQSQKKVLGSQRKPQGVALTLEDKSAFERKKKNRGKGSYAQTAMPGGAVTVDHEGLPAICKAIWEVFGKVKITPNQLAKLSSDIQLGTAVFPSPVELYENGDRKLYLDWLKEVKQHMIDKGKVKGERFAMGAIIPYLCGYGWKWIGYFAWLKRHSAALPQPISGDYVDDDIRNEREVQQDFEKFQNDPTQGHGQSKTMAERLAETARELGYVSNTN